MIHGRPKHICVFIVEGNSADNFVLWLKFKRTKTNCQVTQTSECSFPTQPAVISTIW